MGQGMRWTLVLGVVLLFTGIAQAWPEERPATHNFTCKELDVPMRDGLKLKADLYLPEGAGPFPVIVERTPYGKNDCKWARNGKPAYLAERGYAVLIQDVRGRYRSPGEFTHFLDEGWGERQDGYDTIEWAGIQPWSNGKVGTKGGSYSCFNQNLLAVTQPPHLSAMFCSDSASNWYKDLTYPGGALQQSPLDWQLDRGDEPRDAPDWQAWHRRRIEKRLGYWEAWMPDRLTDYLEHTTYDAWWRNFAPDEHVEKFQVPVYYMSGWYDRFPHSVTTMFNEIRQRAGTKLARESVKLIIGPWLHGQGRSGTTSKTGDMDFGPDSIVNFEALLIRWFDYHLRGLDNSIMREPPVRLFVMGVNQWREENEFPIARAVQTKFYLQSGKTGSIDSVNDGTLSKSTPSASDQPNAYEYDPKTPVESIGGDLFEQPMGVRDHRPADQKSLTFTTPPLTEDMEISGPSSVELYVASTADDTDFVVTLLDVQPDGYAGVLRQSILRASRRESVEKPTPIVPGRVYKLAISIPPISNVFLKGHRLRLTVTSSSFPRYLPNHNKFMLNNEEAPWVVARNTVYHDAQRPSSLTVPVIPAGKGATTVSGR
ncbi:MAG: CocE/NonD family hydrolase [Acidobacteria bacterium]|nr:CocE/NonD family hydrolase [Acidobacteriota bacterium]